MILKTMLLALVAQSTVAFRVPERDLIPEGMTHDPVTGSFFVGSFRKRKIVEIRPDGTVRDFLATGADGFQAAAGMTVDARRRVLWAASCAAPHIEGFGPDTPETTGVFKIDLATGRVLAKTVIPKSHPMHIFNDFALAPDGSLFATGFAGDVVYRIDGDTAAATEFVRTPPGFFPNGIALSDDGKDLFVAGQSGILRIRVEEKSSALLGVPEGETTTSIDGLYFATGRLVAVQHDRSSGKTVSRIALFTLTPDLSRIERVDSFDRAHPLHDQPTTGVVIGGERFVYLANSQFTKFGGAPTFALAPLAELAEVVGLEVRLPSR